MSRYPIIDIGLDRALAQGLALGEARDRSAQQDRQFQIEQDRLRQEAEQANLFRALRFGQDQAEANDLFGHRRVMEEQGQQGLDLRAIEEEQRRMQAGADSSLLTSEADRLGVFAGDNSQGPPAPDEQFRRQFAAASPEVQKQLVLRAQMGAAKLQSDAAKAQADATDRDRETQELEQFIKARNVAPKYADQLRAQLEAKHAGVDDKVFAATIRAQNADELLASLQAQFPRGNPAILKGTVDQWVTTGRNEDLPQVSVTGEQRQVSLASDRRFQILTRKEKAAEKRLEEFRDSHKLAIRAGDATVVTELGRLKKEYDNLAQETLRYLESTTDGTAAPSQRNGAGSQAEPDDGGDIPDDVLNQAAEELPDAPPAEVERRAREIMGTAIRR
jgi:hypothetical protein